MRSPITFLLHTWEDWVAHVAASNNSSACDSTGQSPHFMLFGVEKRLPYALLSSFSANVYNVDDYVKCQQKVPPRPSGQRRWLGICGPEFNPDSRHTAYPSVHPSFTLIDKWVPRETWGR